MDTLLDSPAKLSVSPHVMGAIREDGCNLAVWERGANPSFEALLAAETEDVRFSATLAQLSSRLPNELGQAGYRDTPERLALIEDIVDLAQRYGVIMDVQALSVRLSIITTNRCHKFHADYVKARLITTYVGTGTQWVDIEDAARVAREESPQRIHTMNTGDVGLFKGRIWTQTPAIHRSPPIEGTGETRLMLVLDPPRAD